MVFGVFVLDQEEDAAGAAAHFERACGLEVYVDRHENAVRPASNDCRRAAHWAWLRRMSSMLLRLLSIRGTDVGLSQVERKDPR